MSRSSLTRDPRLHLRPPLYESSSSAHRNACCTQRSRGCWTGYVCVCVLGGMAETATPIWVRGWSWTSDPIDLQGTVCCVRECWRVRRCEQACAHCTAPGKQRSHAGRLRSSVCTCVEMPHASWLGQDEQWERCDTGSRDGCRLDGAAITAGWVGR